MITSSRQCNQCDVCCVIAQVEDKDKGFLKLPNVVCPLLNRSGNKRCTVFGKDTRPDCCSTFQCGWLRGYGSDSHRPDKCGLMLSISNFNNGTWIFALETQKGAAVTTGKDIILDMIRKVNLPVIVVDADSKYPNDRGDYVILTQKMLSKSKQIKGKRLGILAPDVAIYQLTISP